MKALIEIYLGLSDEELSLVWRVVGIVAGSMTAIFTPLTFFFYHLGKIRGWRDNWHDIGRNWIRIQRFFEEIDEHGVPRFVVETGRVTPLEVVFGNSKLVRAVASRIGVGAEGEPLFPPGDNRYRSQGRAGRHVSGNVQQASNSAMFVRPDEYHDDVIAVLLTWVRGDDGEAMATIFEASPAFLLKVANNKNYLKQLESLRTAYGDSKPIVEKMAAGLVASDEIFRKEKNGREAGSQAWVWRVINRTPRVGVSAETVREIVQEELANFFKKMRYGA